MWQGNLKHWHNEARVFWALFSSKAVRDSLVWQGSSRNIHLVWKAVFTAKVIIKPLSFDLGDLFVRAKSQNTIFRTVLNHLPIFTSNAGLGLCHSHRQPTLLSARRQVLRGPPNYSTHGTLITSTPHIFISSMWLPFHPIQRRMKKFSSWKLNQRQHPIIFPFTAELLPSTNLITVQHNVRFLLLFAVLYNSVTFSSPLILISESQ